MVYSNISMAGQIAAPSQRTVRYPSHPFMLQSMPYCITPFLIAPVLPGETLRKLTMQSRVVTDPIKNPLAGWFCEYYLFYVKLTDLYEREMITDLLINPAASSGPLTTIYGATTRIDRFYFGHNSNVNWVEGCLRRVVDEYFRDEGTNYTQFTAIDGKSRNYPLCQVHGNSWLDSVHLQDDALAKDVTLIDAATTDTLLASEVDNGMRLWQAQRMEGLHEMSYEDWLAQFGVQSMPQKVHRPELLRYIREWTYPSNTIDPATGAARSACSWSVQASADKQRFFPEPGFVFGVSVVRPKTYPRGVEGTLSTVLNNFATWLPASLMHPMLSVRPLSTTSGPLASKVTDAEGYVVDVKDLFLYGEHFTNRTLADTDVNYMENISADLSNVRYPATAAAIQELFNTAATAHYARHDGIVNLTIACAKANPLIDTSPRGGPRLGYTTP